MDVRLSLFDLDGVLLDSKRNMEAAWAQVMREHSVAPDFSEYFKHIGKPFHIIMRDLGLSAFSRKIEQSFKRASLEHIKDYRFFPGVVEMLSTIKSSGRMIGVVTSKDEVRTRAALGLIPTTFSVVRTGSRDTRGKPAPDDLLIAMGTAGADPAETVYFGDMSVDCEAAERAGCRYAQCKWGYGTVSDAKTQFSSPREVQEWVTQ